MRVVVVGAGASGLVCAIVLARRGFSVTVVDKLKSSGKKLLVTGNGRCNYWNEDFDNKHFYSNNKDFIECINTSQNRESVMEFFKSVGITPTIKNGYYYPMSMQASSIRDTLLLEANRLGVTFLNDFNVTEIKYINDTFFVVGEGECFCDKLIIATGSYSYYNDKTSGYDICKSFGHTIKPVLPSLVQLIGSDNFYKDWAGVRSSSKVSIYVDEKLEKEEKGEIMLTDYGISGICVFNLSGIANRAIYDNKKVRININFLPEIDNLYDFFEERNKIINYSLNDFLISLLNNKLVSVILKSCDLNKTKKWNELNSVEKNNLVDKISSFPVNIISSKSFDNSQVCTGGIDTSEVDPYTLESKLRKGLYIIGEILDVDGDCGGYNLGFAWLTAVIAGRSVTSD